MSGWGVGEWGTDPWGSVGAPSLARMDPLIADVEGGTLLTLFGAGFADPVTVTLFDGLIPVGTAYYGNPDRDLRPKKLIVGLPALPAGSYSVQASTPGGSSNVLSGLVYKVFAEEHSVLEERSRWGSKWLTGERVLR